MAPVSKKFLDRKIAAPLPRTSLATALSRQLYRARIESSYWPASCRCDGILPMCGRFGSEDPQCGSGDEVALKVEGVVNRTVHAQEALGGSSRLEPLQLALPSSDCLMRILRPLFLRSPCSCRQFSRRRRNAAA